MLVLHPEQYMHLQLRWRSCSVSSGCMMQRAACCGALCCEEYVIDQRAHGILTG